MKDMRSPVLFVIFNRPETTAQVFEVIRACRPPKLYIAADGPRPDVPGEQDKCRQSREMAMRVDWPCDVKTLFRDENSGCKHAVSTAISWFFKNEPEGIILEDDCLPDPSFFRFCDELLAHYRDDERVFTISGSYLSNDHFISMESYFFSRHFRVWGWASWRRAWEHYDINMPGWPKIRKSSVLKKIGDNNIIYQNYWKSEFDRTYSGKINTWDYQWLYAHLIHGRLTILPRVNLVKNIGFGGDATHTSNTNSLEANLNLHSMQFPLIHPEAVFRNNIAEDKRIDFLHFGIEQFKHTKRRSFHTRLRSSV